MKYEVIYQSINGTFSLPSHTKAKAKTDVARLKKLNKTPGYAAWGIKIVRI